MKRLSNRLRHIAVSMTVMASMACFGQEVSYNQALKLAGDFFRSKGIDTAPTAMHRAKGTETSQTGNSAYYIINTDGAYAVVSGDSRVGPILAYSLDAPYDAENVAPAAAHILAGYEAYINAVAAGEAEAPAPLSLNITEGKLLSTASWNQSGEPWNTLCPVIGGQRAPGGCAATAMSIIMRYHSSPASYGIGSKTYTPQMVDTPLTADFSATDYQIGTIPTDGSYYSTTSWTAEQKKAAATLIYHAGIAANMEYDQGGSGTKDIFALVGLSQYFGYTMGSIVQMSSFTDTDEYLKIIIDEIDNGYPMLYSGYSDGGGGHMFVCDGYDADGMLHFNLGWGYGGDYYTVLPDSPSLTYHNYQSALTGIRPNRTTDAPSVFMPYVGEDEVTIIGDGKISRGKQFFVKVKGLVNTADQTIGLRLSLKICDALGNIKEEIFVSNTNSNGIPGTYWINEIPVTLPLSYNYEAGDKIVVYYSIDESATWAPVPCFEEDANSLSLDEVYDNSLIANMVMVKPTNAECRGLTLDNSSTINLDGNDFVVWTNYLCNWSGFDFFGDLAIFICDSDGEPVKKVGNREVLESEKLRNNYYRDFRVVCNIPAGTTVESGSRLIAFARYSGQEAWQKIGCAEDEKGYILIPEELCTGPATSETVTFTRLMATYSSEHDIDFSGVTGFYAFKVVMQDRETLILQRINELKSGEGVLLWGQDQVDGMYTGTLNYKEGAASNSDNLLIGVLTDTQINNTGSDVTNYIFGATATEVGFYQANGETVPAGQAYMRIGVSPSNAPARYAFYMSGDTSGIIGVACDAPADNTIYNMQGMKVTRPTNDIYIVNGKKVIIRM